MENIFKSISEIKTRRNGSDEENFNGKSNKHEINLRIDKFKSTLQNYKI